jgi:hypothetical protein
VTELPTFIFYRGGNKCGHLSKPTKKDLFEKLDELTAQQK